MQVSDEAELSAALADAKTPLAIRGGGTRRLGASEADDLDVSALEGITLYEPGALTLVAKAGTRLDDIAGALSAEGQRLAFEPPDLRALLGREGQSTVGGVVAANASGPRRVQAGACRDFALGVRFVDGSGNIIKNGGRVMKNVTGYDLVKLMAGSCGTLGALSEVSLKVMPAPETTATLAIAGLEPSKAVEAMSAALGSPFDVTGAAHLPDDGGTLIRFEGFEASVAYRSAQLTERLSAYGDVAPVQDDAIWTTVRDATPMITASGNIWRVSVKPSDGPAVLATVPEVDRWMMDWGGGLVWLGLDPAIDLRARMAGIKGHATLIRGTGFPIQHPEDAAVAALTAGLRAKFDPKGLFSTDRPHS